MIVFISSVSRGPEDERDYLPGLLKASGHVPRRFEDFSAQPVPSRDACLAGVEAAEVYLLLLGHHYGEPLPDTGKSPTEEEYTVARRRGVPIVVFRKAGVAADELQQDFITRVGGYQQGRFWKEFRDNGELAVAVLDSLREVAAQGAGLRWEPAVPEPVVRWRPDRAALADGSAGYVPVLEVHLASVAGGPVLPVAALQPLASRLGRAGRDAGLFPESASVDLGSDTSSAWARSSARSADGGWNRVRRDGPAGVAADRDGSVIAFQPLARDGLGSLVSLAGMATYDAQATRRRLLDAACAEFAQYGIAGARVDRIGEAAGSNKAQIYHYFGGKAQLFEAVCEQAIMQMEAEVPFDPYDLPGYAGRLVRLHERRPEIMRLCTWQRLERTDGDPSQAGVAFARAQIDAIARAQKNGDLPAHFHPGFLLGLVLHLATGWVSVSPEFEAAIDVPDTDDRARHVENAIRTLLSQPAPA